MALNADVVGLGMRRAAEGHSDCRCSSINKTYKKNRDRAMLNQNTRHQGLPVRKRGAGHQHEIVATN